MNKNKNRVQLSTLVFLIFVALNFLYTPASIALEPKEILVVANRNVSGSVGLAKYYMKKRRIQEERLLRLWVTDKETISRKDYEKKIVRPIRKRLLKYTRSERPRCLVLMFGVPLKITPIPLNQKEKDDIGRLRQEHKHLNDALKNESDAKRKNSLKQKAAEVKRSITRINNAHNTGASVDSELMLLMSKTYPHAMWIPNPYFVGYKNKSVGISKDDVTMVSRLDGPSNEIVRRIIDDSMAAEKDGLTGSACFDARWKDPGDKKTTGYGFYDRSIHRAAKQVREMSDMKVVINSEKTLFQPGDCPDTALYCGWYRLARYVDAFNWRPGAVGYHIASQECQTLRKGSSQVWCKRMLEEGVAATVGPVSEPYVQSFPVPEVFFKFLIEGNLTLAECYLISLPHLSWKMVLVGDPLYRPFKAEGTGQEAGKSSES